MPPKTASNSIKELLVNSNILPVTPKKETLPHIHLKLSEIKYEYELDSLSDFKILQIVRNPYDRMVSSYFHKLRMGDIFGNKKIEFQKFLELILECKTINNFPSCLYEDYTIVNKSITSKIHWGGSRLFESQSRWNDLNYDFNFFKLEDLKNDTSHFSKIVGAETQKLKIINKNTIDIDYSTFLTEHNKSLIEKIFYDDFENFSY